MDTTAPRRPGFRASGEGPAPPAEPAPAPVESADWLGSADLWACLALRYVRGRPATVPTSQPIQPSAALCRADRSATVASVRSPEAMPANSRTDPARTGPAGMEQLLVELAYRQVRQLRGWEGKDHDR